MMVMKRLRRMLRTIYLDTCRRLSLVNVCLLAAIGMAGYYIFFKS